MAKTLPFRTMLDPAKEITSNAGSKFENIMAMRLTETGEEEFYVKGQTNVYEKTQMFKDECDLEKILMRCTETGDISLLNKRDPFFMDMEDMPENIFEMHQKIKAAEQEFDNMPLSVKEAYGFSFDRFLADFGTENWLKNIRAFKEETKEEEKTTKGEEVAE